MFSLFYFIGAAITLLLGIWLWVQILDMDVTPANILLSFVYNLFPAVAWPLYLPLTVIAYLCVRFPQTSIFCRRSQTADNHINNANHYSLDILKFRLDSSKLYIRNATIDEVSQVDKLSEQMKCAICLENIEMRVNRGHPLKPRDDDVSMTRCSHMFHYKCIKNWILKDSTCPVCREGQVIESLRFFCQNRNVKTAKSNNNQSDKKSCTVSESTVDESKSVMQTVEFKNNVSKDEIVIRVDLLSGDSTKL